MNPKMLEPMIAKSVCLLLLLLANAAVASAQDSKTGAEPPKPLSAVIQATPAVPAKPQPPPPSARPATLDAGAVAPDFVSQDVSGKAFHLSDWKEKVIVLDFWATWCGPCMHSLPHTQEVAQRYKDQGVIVLAVCTSDTRANFSNWVKANRAKYADVVFTCEPIERGAANYDGRPSAKLYGVRGIPTQFIIGRDGKISTVLVGYSDGDARLEASLAQLGLKACPAVQAKPDK